MNFIAYCGLDCERCLTYLAWKTDDDDVREKTAREREKNFAAYIGKAHLDAQEMNCAGCKSEGPLFVGCKNCPIKACAMAKEVEGCWACASYESCGMIKDFHSQAPEARERSERLRG
jgi:hypothetical protein